MQAYVLVQTTSDSGPIARDLEVIPGVSFAQDLRGPYDAIVMAGSSQQSLEITLSKIRDVPGVTRALSAPLTSSLLEAPGTEAA